MSPTEKSNLEAIKSYAEQVLGEDKTGHDMSHINRVVRLATIIQASEGGDLFLCLSGAYLHDVMDDKLVESTEEAREDLLLFLAGLGLTEVTISHLVEIIDNVSFSHQLAPSESINLSLEAKIVQDADRLDAIGAIGIARTFYYGGKKGHTMYDPEVLPREQMTKDDYRVNQSVINHFYEKLFKLPDLLQTKTAKKLAIRRVELMEVFVDDFIKEWEMI
ncbi:HD domain-containing protein [Vagococcus sp. DIV0080]|uniref:HD domain-containing protein n=1 Tax=Candidatus Vagococcus giribetii TaxID=2230876 RepID=A0ABS3HS37_9ENTE|nr:HD domain-containing protein [Vagococcus sp. DIV0080]MBO0476575.1 HD domain-containing protein [Vagococcus sp. DIV0080]